MTYEELINKDEWYLSFPDWGDDDEVILAKIKAKLKANGNRHYFKVLTDLDMSLNTSVKDLVQALLNAGFPKENLVVESDDKAQIMLEGMPYTISTTQAGRSYLYEDNSPLNFINFIHTPAGIMAAYLVHRYCSPNWLENEAQRNLEKYKLYWKWVIKGNMLAEKRDSLRRVINNAIFNYKEYVHYFDDYIKANAKYLKHARPEISEEEIKAISEKEWEDIVKVADKSRRVFNPSKEEIEQAKIRAEKAQKRAEKARERYQKVGKQQREAKKQQIIEQKKALLFEYKEKYGVECKFIYVHSPYDPHHRFVVPAVEGQVVSFFVPDKFEHDFYDRAMELVSFLNELTKTYGKKMVQKKGSLPKDANDSLSKLLVKLGIAHQWQGIYNEAQRHYLDGRYKEEVVM